MADSVVKLRIDSKEYDANIKRAGQALTDYFNKVREGGGTLEHLDEGVLEAVQALGDMATKADNTRGALRELTQATTDMTIAYRNLTDEEKNSPIGQAMADSIQRMTERAGDMRDAMGDVQASINHMASDTRVWDQLSGGTTLVTSSIQSLQGAAKLLGIEMGDNVEVIARLQAAMAVTNGLTQIQNLLQKESAFMQGLNAAKAAMSSAAHALLAGNLSAAAVAQGALNVAMKAAPWAIAAAAIYAVCDALGVFGSSTESAKSSQDDLNRSLNKTKELLRDIETAYSVQQFYTGIMGGQTTGEQLTSESNYLLSERQKIQDRMNQLNLLSEYPSVGELVLPFNLDEYNELSNKLGEIDDKLNLVGKKQVALAEARKKFDAGWESLTDPREIRAAISYYQELSKNLNTSPEYNGTYEVYQDRIAQLQEKLRKPIRPTTSTTGGNGKSIVDDIIPPGSIEELNKRIQDLQKAQSLSITTSQWISYEQQIDRLTEKVNILKGVLPKDQEAVFTINTNDEDVINKLRNIEGVKIDDKTLNISTNIGNILHDTDELNGINIHDKTFVVTADTQEAMRAVQKVTENIEGVTVDLKVKPVIEPLGNGINIQNKAGLSEYIAQLEKDLSVTSFSSTDYQAIQRQIADAKMLQTLIGESLKVGLGTALFDIQNDQGLDFWSRVITPDGVENADWQAIADVINAKRKEMGLDAIKLDFGEGSASEVNSKSNTEVMQRLVGGLSSVTSGIQQMGVRIPDNLQKTIGAIQGLMTVIQGVQSIIQMFSTGTATAQVASTTANTIQLGILNSFMPALIASNGLKSISPFGFMANGGIVGKAASGMLIPGNSFSGDNLRMPVVGGGVIGVNSGELILSRSQQDSIAAQLENEEPQGVGIQPYVDGEKIFLGMNNTSKRMGRGEIVTTSMLKKFGLI